MDIDIARTEIITAMSSLQIALEYLDEPKIKPGYLSPHFRISEMDCNHCGLYGDRASANLMAVLEDVREHFGNVPVTINSGVRCNQHNDNVGGASNSRHKIEYADAADIVVKGMSPNSVHAYLSGKYPDKYGIGSYNTFTHIDTRPGGPARWAG